jgi:hypothetical protein
MPGECDIKPLAPVGIATSIKFYPESPLEHGKYLLFIRNYNV